MRTAGDAAYGSHDPLVLNRLATGMASNSFVKCAEATDYFGRFPSI